MFGLSCVDEPNLMPSLDQPFNKSMVLFDSIIQRESVTNLH